MDDLSLRVYLENGSDAMRGGWLELPVVPERLDAFMRGVVGVDDGGGYAVVDHEPGWFGDVLGSDLESFSVSSLNLAARCVAHARDLAVADSVDGDVFLDMLATAAESEDVRFPSGIAALAAHAGDVAEFWTEYSLPDSWRAGNYAFDHFAKPREIEQKANGRPVAINFRPGEPVRLFRGVGPERRTLEISNPWDLCRAVKAHNDEYARSRQEAAAMSAEASQARGAAGGADEFDTFGEPADVQDGYLPGDPADPTTMLDPSSGMGATL